MKILVTGGGGFVASRLVPRLRTEGNDVIAIDNRPGCELADIREPSSLERFKNFDAVIHLAAIAVPDICSQHQAEAFNTNVRGTFNVLDWASRNEVKKVVFVSSAHVYGISRPHSLPSKETDPLMFHDIYTTTKILGERLCRLFYENNSLAFTALRLFNVYGPSQTFNYFLPSIITRASVMGKVVLQGCDTTKDFVYIDDVVTAFIAALKSEYVGEINIGSGKETKLIEVASFVASYFDAQVTPHENQPPVTRMQADISKAKGILGWEPETNLEDGLSKTIDAFLG